MILRKKETQEERFAQVTSSRSASMMFSLFILPAAYNSVTNITINTPSMLIPNPFQGIGKAACTPSLPVSHQ